MERVNLARFLAESAAELLAKEDNNDARRLEAEELMNLGTKLLARDSVKGVLPVREAA